MKCISQLNTLVAIISLCPSSTSSFIAYPSNTTTGSLILFDAINLKTVSAVSAHKSRLGVVVFNDEGNLIASCSDKVLCEIIGGLQN